MSDAAAQVPEGDTPPEALSKFQAAVNAAEGTDAASPNVVATGGLSSLGGKALKWSVGSMPFYETVPKTLLANIAFRQRIVDLGNADAVHAETIRNMCAKDPLFYINTFVWTYDPRQDSPKIPFITYPFQDDAMMELFKAIKLGHDMGIEKSRDMGASWMLLLAFEYLWHFYSSQSFLIVSRKEDLVDKKGDPDSLFWKVDFIYKHLPPWLKPRRTRKLLNIVNLENGSTFDGDSTSGDIARGGRRTAIGLDEFASVDNGYAVLASTGDATKCRLFNSTPKGTGNAFYDQIMSGMKKLTLHWTVHPVKRVGIYLDDDGRPRSTWYDAECRRRMHPLEIAQELDIDYSGSDYQFFDAVQLRDIQKEDVFLPCHRCEVLHNEQTGEYHGLEEHYEGRLRLWIPMVGAGVGEVEDDFVVAVDIATGTGASNSVISVGRKGTGEKIAEWVDNNTRPEALARVALAICKMFKSQSGLGAFLIWEANGPGRNFGDVIIESGYRNVYWRKSGQGIAKSSTDIPGWWSSKDTKMQLLTDYRRGWMQRLIRNPSKESYDEARQYVFMTGGKVAHSRSANKMDPSSANENHGDRVIADALLLLGIGKSVMISAVERERPAGSLARRMDHRKQRRAKKREGNFW